MTVKCPSWGATELLHDTRDQPYINKGEQTVISHVTGDHCPACGEVVLDREQGDRYSERVGAFQRQVNAAYVDRAFIAKVRKKLRLDQREAADIFWRQCECLFALRERQDQAAAGPGQTAQAVGPASGVAQGSQSFLRALAYARYHLSCSSSRPSAAATFSSVALRGCLTRSICA